jgi:hypothetical protein
MRRKNSHIGTGTVQNKQDKIHSLYNEQRIEPSVADPGCLSRILIFFLSISNSGSYRYILSYTLMYLIELLPKTALKNMV